VTASITGTSNNIAVSAAAGTHFTVLAPASATAGTAFNFTVTALDQFNNTASTYAGTVHFTSSDSAATLPVNSTLATGAGTFSATLNTVGNRTVTATDTVTSSITGTSNSVNVGSISTTTSISPSSATVPYGTAQTFTATVTGAPGTPTGTVTFTDTTTSTTLGSSTLNGSSQASQTVTLAAGSHTIQATYNGDGTHSGSSNTTSVTVNKAVLTVTANNASTSVGVAVPILTATITGFVNGDTSAVVTGAPALTTTATVSSPAGNYQIVPAAGTLAAANYSFAFVNGTLVITLFPTIVSKTGGTTSAGSSIYLGQSFTTPSGGPWINFSFSFFSDQGVSPQAAGTAYLFTAPYNGTPGGLSGNLSPQTVAMARSARLAAPGPQVAAAGFVAASVGISGGAYVFPPSVVLQPNTQYFIYEDGALSGVLDGSGLTGGNGYGAASPASTFGPLGSSANFRVTGSLLPPPPLVSSVALSSSLNPSSLGQAVTFTAAVSGSGNTPTGTVQFLDSATPLGTAAVSGGVAVFSTAALAAGSHFITAAYSGGAGYPPAQASITQRVTALASTLTATANPPAPVFGRPVTLTAAVGPAIAPTGFAPPTGQVTFALESGVLFAPPATLGTAPLASGGASLTINNLAVGSHLILVGYSGDSTWSAATREISVTVSPAPTAATVSMTVVSGKPVLTSAVSAVAPGSGTPTGTVRFIDTSNNAALANAALSGGSASATAPSTAAGHPVTAVYSGDANFQGSTAVPLPAVTNAASDGLGNLAPEEVASLSGVTGLTGDTSGQPPLQTSLGGVAVKITDSAGTARSALLYGVFASAGQINLAIPGDAAAGLAALALARADGTTVATAINIAGIAPGIFTANANGQGVFAGQVIHVHADGSQTIADSSVWSASVNAFAANPIGVGPVGDRVVLVLYGTGIRHAASVTAAINGTAAPVLFSGAQGQFPGLDQINIELPRTLAAGPATLTITADGQTANPVTLAVQ
jgi:uncharacterized protein (TIGR03437 family)